MAKKLTSITDEEFYAELGRRRSAARLTHKGGRAASCDCGICLKCRKREAVRKFRAKVAAKKAGKKSG